MSSRHLQDMSSTRLQDMSSRRLQDKSSRRLQDVFKTNKCLLGTVFHLNKVKFVAGILSETAGPRIGVRSSFIFIILSGLLDGLTSDVKYFLMALLFSQVLLILKTYGKN